MTTPNLSELLAKAKVDNTKLVKRPVVWVREDDEGNEVTDSFDVFVVADISFAAQERIYLGDGSEIDTGRMARAISERLRFGPEGKEKMTHEQASLIQTSLGLALTKCINDYFEEVKKSRKVDDAAPAKE